MALSIHEGDHHFTGTVSVATGFGAPAGTITNAMIAAATGVDVSKLDHRHVQVYAQEAECTAVDALKVVHVAKAAGTLSGFKVFVDATAVGDSVLTVDVEKASGAAGAFASILSAAYEVSSAGAALTVLDAEGSIATAAYAADAVFRVKVDVTVGTGTVPTGLVVQLTFDEEAQ